MQTSTLTSKGQITIPAEVRRQLGLHPGDHMGFMVENGVIHLVRKESRIEAAFGICKSPTSVSIEDMEQVIRQQAGR